MALLFCQERGDIVMWTNSARRRYERHGGRRAAHPTDPEFALIEPFLPPPKPPGRSRTTSLREVLNAILCVLRSGGQWRPLPGSFPPISAVDGCFRQFWQLGIWTRIWLSLLIDGRERAGKEASPSAAILDGQSVKTMESGWIGCFDTGKKVPSGASWPCSLRESAQRPAGLCWVIERTSARLGRNRRLAKDAERLIETATAMLVGAIAEFLVRRHFFNGP
jgi:transposase